MSETIEMIQLCLDTAGEEIVFQVETIVDLITVITEVPILAIPGVSVYSIQNYSSPFDIEKQVYTFMTSIAYFKSLTIEVGLEFTFTLGTRVHAFTVSSWSEPEPNWIRLRADLISSVG